MTPTIDRLLITAEQEVADLEAKWRSLKMRQRRFLMRSIARHYPRKAIWKWEDWQGSVEGEVKGSKVGFGVLEVIGFAVLSWLVQRLCQWLWDRYHNGQLADHAELKAMLEEAETER